MRIFHGTVDVAGVPGLLAGAQRELGHDAESRVFLPESPEFMRPPFRYSADGVLTFPRTTLGRVKYFGDFARSFEVFQLYFGHGLFGAKLLDVPTLKRLGRKVCFYFCGCDVRDEKKTIMRYPVSACRECFPKVCMQTRAQATRVAERYGHVNFVSTPDLLEFVERSVLMPSPYDAERVARVLEEPAPRPNEAAFVVAHAPSNRLIKGTRYLERAVADLRGEGVRIELLLLEGMQHEDVLRAARSADLAVDQLLVGAYGLFAVEMMALGVPVAVFLRPDLRARYPEPPPVLDVTREGIAALLRDAVRGKLLLDDLSVAGRAYAERVHHPLRVAEACLAHYA